MFEHNFMAFVNFFMYVGLSMSTLYLFLILFIWWTPGNEIQRIKENSISDAITLGGVSIGFTIPLLICSYLQSGVVAFIELALLIGAFQLLLEKLMTYFLESKNTATAVFHSCISVCVGAIIGFSIIP